MVARRSGMRGLATSDQEPAVKYDLAAFDDGDHNRVTTYPDEGADLLQNMLFSAVERT
jgi:hypothetical protein